MIEDKEFEDLMKQGDMFHKYNGHRTCKTCAHAMPFKKSIVCGIWHCSFSDESFCDHYKTQDERKAELNVWKEKQMNDPNSLYNRYKNKLNKK